MLTAAGAPNFFPAILPPAQPRSRDVATRRFLVKKKENFYLNIISLLYYCAQRQLLYNNRLTENSFLSGKVSKIDKMYFL